MTAVLSGNADIGFMGSEASIYTYNEGANDYVVNFAQLTQRAGNFLVAREKIDDFSWENLKGKEVLGGRKGGMPEMVFEYILKQHKIRTLTLVLLPQRSLKVRPTLPLSLNPALLIWKKRAKDMSLPLSAPTAVMCHILHFPQSKVISTKIRKSFKALRTHCKKE